MSKTYRCDSYDKSILQSNMMGPNAMRVLEDLAEGLDFSGKRVLDLGCGAGLTSIYLAKECGAQVFAADLWIDATDNYKRFREFGLEDQIIPLSANAEELPFAEGYFDAVVSVDAYHYFGTVDGVLDNWIAPFLKPGGTLAVAIPGLKEEFTDGPPKELAPYLPEETYFHSLAWWRDLWSKSAEIELQKSWELPCFLQAWLDWLACDNPYAVGDRDMMKAEGGKYYNLVGLIAVKK